MISENDSISNRLVLGTVQLGMPYGVANQTGQPDLTNAKEIVATAWDGGIREFDTAQGYGNSEEVLGYAFKALGIEDRVHTITKLDPKLDYHSTTALTESIQNSMKKIGVKRLFGLMLHRENLLDRWDVGLGKCLTECISSGMIKKIGVSVYSPEKAMEALNIEGISMVQIPSNILDQRFLKNGIFEVADRLNKTLYVRSIFLQGLLLLDGAKLSTAMRFAKEGIDAFGDIAKKFGMTRPELALGYAKIEFRHAKILFGAETSKQIAENLRLWTSPLPPEIIKEIKEMFRNVEEKVINPKLWPAV